MRRCTCIKKQVQRSIGLTKQQSASPASSRTVRGANVVIVVHSMPRGKIAYAERLPYRAESYADALFDGVQRQRRIRTSSVSQCQTARLPAAGCRPGPRQRQPSTRRGLKALSTLATILRRHLICFATRQLHCHHHCRIFCDRCAAPLATSESQTADGVTPESCVATRPAFMMAKIITISPDLHVCHVSDVSIMYSMIGRNKLGSIAHTVYGSRIYCYWRANVVCPSVCLWRYALWLNDISYNKSV